MRVLGWFAGWLCTAFVNRSAGGGPRRIATAARGVAAALVVWLATAPPAVGQAVSGWVGLGAFAAFPDDFAEPYCSQDAWGAEGGVRVSAGGGWALEVTAAAANGLGGVMCAIPTRAAPSPGAIFFRERTARGVPRSRFYATGLGLAWEAPLEGVGIRMRAGVDRMWDKDAFAFRLGAAAPFTFRGRRLDAGVTAWVVDLAVERDRIFVEEDGSWAVLGRSRLRRYPLAVLVRVAYRWP